MEVDMGKNNGKPSMVSQAILATWEAQISRIVVQGQQ
jgi:hypothetical protein